MFAVRYDKHANKGEGEGRSKGRANLATGWVELVISISRVTRFVRAGGNAFGAKLPTHISHKSTEDIATIKTAPKPAVRVSNPLIKEQIVRTASQLKQRPRMLTHVGVSLVIILTVLVGGLNARESNQTVTNSQAASTFASPTGYGGVADETASAYIAAGVAQEVNLPVADEVVKTAEAITSKATYSSVAADDYLNKPQLVSTAGNLAKGIQTYVVQAGDTVDSIAAQFDISADTVRNANNIVAGSEPSVGQELTILPVDGLLHTVSDTDTAAGLALLYQTSADLIVRYNDAEVNGLTPGAQVVIPNGVKNTPAASLSGRFAFAPSFGGNGYDYGWCTWHAANRRAAAGHPIPSNWGNAIGWKYNAVSSGYGVGNTPQPGAVVYHNNLGGWGHVAYVERVTSDGAWFSDMNYPLWGAVTERFVPASEYSNYSFIY